MPKMRIYSDEDCTPGLLRDKKICVVGYGSQGRAFALNLRDSGCQITVLVRQKSSSRQQAVDEGLILVDARQVKESEVIVFAIPDHAQPTFYRRHLRGRIKHPWTLVFLHGLNFHFGNIDFDDNHDTVLIAPLGPGGDLREKYLSGEGLSCWLAVGHDHSGQAMKTALAVACGIGSGKANIFETTFRDETLGDLFGEQAVLVGGLVGLTMTAFDVLVEKGINPGNAYLETIAQLKLLAAMMEQSGPVGMMERVSKTAAFGSAIAGFQLFDRQFERKLKGLYNSIESGKFNKLLQKESQIEFRKLQRLLKALRKTAAQTTHETFQTLKQNRQNQ